MRGMTLRRGRSRRIAAVAALAALAAGCATAFSPDGRAGALVTVGQWNACAAAGGCPFRLHGPAGAPATEVSWDDAQAYLGWLSAREGRRFRLPRLAEWTPRGGDLAEWLDDCHPVSDAPPGAPCSHRLIRPVAEGGPEALSPSLRLTDVGFSVISTP